MAVWKTGNHSFSKTLFVDFFILEIFFLKIAKPITSFCVLDSHAKPSICASKAEHHVDSRFGFLIVLLWHQHACCEIFMRSWQKHRFVVWLAYVCCNMQMWWWQEQIVMTACGCDEVKNNRNRTQICDTCCLHIAHFDKKWSSANHGLVIQTMKEMFC